MVIKGKKVTLRSIEVEDLELLMEMLNDPEIEALVIGWSFPVSMNDQRNWIAKNTNTFTNQRYIIEDSDGTAIGMATLADIDWKNRIARHGIKLAFGSRRSKGVGTDTVMAIMRYAFDELNLNRLEGSWLTDNIPSKKLYLKCGWVVEGIKKHSIFKNGSYKDQEICRILNSEYQELIARNRYWDETDER